MDDWTFFPWVFLIPVIAIIGGITVAIVSTIMRSRLRELEIRERIAMIERGLVPPPEKDPQGFDRAMNRYDAQVRAYGEEWQGRSPGRYRSAGITMMGIGLGLMLMITFAGNDPNAGIGVGGFIAVIGLAFFINSLFTSRYQPVVRPPTREPGEPPHLT
jgi:Domain of unknown function (DUF6249)